MTAQQTKSSDSYNTNTAEFWSRQLKFWLGSVLVLGLLLWVFSPILLPFVLGVVIAYLLNPAVNALGQFKISRIVSTLIILGGFFAVLVCGLGILFPIVSAEIMKLLKNTPDYLNQLWAMTEPYRASLEKHIGDEEMEQLRSNIESSSGKLLTLSQNFLGGLVSSGQAFIGFMSVMIITPVVAFYMMIEWPRITKWIDSYIPKHHYTTVRQILDEINEKLSGFIRGQFLVAFVLGVFYATAMKIAGLNFGLVIGIAAGLLSIIPMVGSTVGLLAGITVAYFQTYEFSYVATIAAIFLAGQIFEGYVLTPKLVGDRVGLHPLWILFALMAGGALFGFVGVLIAVPVAAVISVLVAFVLMQYKQSNFYSAKGSRQKSQSHNDENATEQ